MHTPSHTHTHPPRHTHLRGHIKQPVDKSPEYCKLCRVAKRQSEHTPSPTSRAQCAYLCVCCVCGCKQAKEHANISFARWQVNTEVEVNAGRGGAKWHWPKMKWKARPGEQTQRSNSHVCVAVIGSP